MRRAKPISVVVKAPSRGLVMRLPSLSADLMPTNSGQIQSTILSTAAYQRASAVSQNVRYEDGVVCAAPGYQRITLSSSLLQAMVAYWPLTEAGGTRFDATPNYLNLTDIPGTSPGIPDVTSGAGILNGMAALFPSAPAGTTFDARKDAFHVDGALSSGFINPLIESPPRDLFTMDGALSSGSTTEIVLPESAPADKASIDGALSSGTHTETVVIGDVADVTFVTGETFGSVHAAASVDAGMHFTVGSNPIVVTALGRTVLSGNTRSHTLILVAKATLTTVASVSITTSGKTPNKFTYAPLSSPVTLAPGLEYYLASVEAAGGDTYYRNDSAITTTSVATNVYAAQLTGGVWQEFPASPGLSYGLVDFKYQGGAPPGDFASFDSAISAGTYTLEVIVSTSPSDEFSVDGALSSGTYTETVIGPETVTDKFSLDSALLSGSYS